MQAFLSLIFFLGHREERCLSNGQQTVFVVSIAESTVVFVVSIAETPVLSVSMFTVVGTTVDGFPGFHGSCTREKLLASIKVSVPAA